MIEPATTDPLENAGIQRLDDRDWRLSNLYWIVSKGDDGEDVEVLFRPNAVQRRILRGLHSRNLILKARQLGCCLDPDTLVLTAELRWVRIADLRVGDEVVGVDEFAFGGRGKARKMRTASVQGVVATRGVAYRITFDDRSSVVCTGRHPWLSRKIATDVKWRSIDGTGNAVTGRLKIGTKVKRVTRPWNGMTVDDGWFGGMLDGEGSLATKTASGGEVNVSQRYGPVWDRVLRYLSDRGYNFRIEDDLKPERNGKLGTAKVPKACVARMDEMFRLIGQTRPTRFIGRRWWEGRELPGKSRGNCSWATITKIDKLDERTMIDLQTSTGTYIADGLVSHNTTLITLLWLDTALFSKGAIRCGIIAHERDAAEAIFRDKVLFAYQRLPEELRLVMPLAKQTASELQFEHNGASIRVATSMRSGTTHRLLVSELGKISAKYPLKAREVVTGSLPSVPKSGIAVVESTAEGQDGTFFDMTQAAQAMHEQRTPLTARDYRFHFFPWWQEPGYSLPPEQAALVLFTPGDVAYFQRVEGEIGRALTLGQRAWYVTTLRADFAGEAPLMWQEYPSFPREAFQVSLEGCYYSTQLALARQQGRIRPGLPIEAVPVNTFWDIGRGDMNCIWLHQRVGPENRFLRYYEASGEDISHYARWLLDQGFVYGRHYLPHEAAHRRMGETPDTNRTIEEMLQAQLPGHRTSIVPRVTTLAAGIQATRNVFGSCWFDEGECAQGLKRLGAYRRKWDKVRGCWSTEHEHNDDSHGADAYRQFGQEADSGNRFGSGIATPGSAPKVSRSAAGRSRWRSRQGSPMAA